MNTIIPEEILPPEKEMPVKGGESLKKGLSSSEPVFDIYERKGVSDTDRRYRVTNKSK